MHIIGFHECHWCHCEAHWSWWLSLGIKTSCVFCVALFPVLVPGFINSLWIISAFFESGMQYVCSCFSCSCFTSWVMTWRGIRRRKRQSALVCNGIAILETCLHVMCSNVCACVRWMLKCWYLWCICVFEYLLKHWVGTLLNHSLFPLPLQGTFLALGLVRVVVIFRVLTYIDICVFVSVCQTWCFQGQSTIARAALPRTNLLLDHLYESVCVWVCVCECVIAIVCCHYTHSKK